MKLGELLLEAPKTLDPKFSSLNVSEAVRLLNSECKSSLWMLKKNRPFYRGMIKIVEAERNGFALVNTSATERESENTTNYYTVLLDNNPMRKNFPKRSRSFIGSTSLNRASDYGYEVYVMIPTDSAKIGCVNKPDMWDTKIKLFGGECNIDELNNSWKYMGLTADIESFVKFDRNLKAGEKSAVNAFKQTFGDDAYSKYGKHFLESIWEAYGVKTGHKAFTAETFPHNLRNSEIWVGGRTVIITRQMWKSLQKAL